MFQIPKEMGADGDAGLASRLARRPPAPTTRPVTSTTKLVFEELFKFRRRLELL